MSKAQTSARRLELHVGLVCDTADAYGTGSLELVSQARFQARGYLDVDAVVTVVAAKKRD